MARTKLRKIITKINSLDKKISMFADIGAKKKALELQRNVQDFITSGSLTPKLRPRTVGEKERKEQPYPTFPLYGWGEENSKSMLKGIKIRKIKNGYRVQPEGSHHSGLKMQTVYMIHEYGAKLKNGGKIPARKLIRKSVDAYNRNAPMENEKLAKEIKWVL